MAHKLFNRKVHKPIIISYKHENYSLCIAYSVDNLKDFKTIMNAQGPAE